MGLKENFGKFTQFFHGKFFGFSRFFFKFKNLKIVNKFKQIYSLGLKKQNIFFYYYCMLYSIGIILYDITSNYV